MKQKRISDAKAAISRRRLRQRGFAFAVLSVGLFSISCFAGAYERRDQSQSKRHGGQNVKARVPCLRSVGDVNYLCAVDSVG